MEKFYEPALINASHREAKMILNARRAGDGAEGPFGVAIRQ
jgi:hypothetical protein